MCHIPNTYISLYKIFHETGDILLQFYIRSQFLNYFYSLSLKAKQKSFLLFLKTLSKQSSNNTYPETEFSK